MTAAAIRRSEEISSSWPTVVSDDIFFLCLESYCRATIWFPSIMCCVCGLICKDMEEIILNVDSEPVLDFSPLLCRDPLMTSVADFQYGFDVIDDTILDRTGFKC